jgi:ankyrin repeat protein
MPCAVDKKGNNAFMGVAFKGHLQVAKWLLENTVCNVNHQNYAGQTALMMASLFGREDIIRLLLEHGANPDLKDRQGNTSIKLAQAQGLSRVVEIIQFHFQ